LDIKKLFKEESPSELITQALKEKMDEGNYDKLEAFCVDKNINYDYLSRVKGNIDVCFELLEITAYRKNRIQKIITYINNHIKSLESFIE